MSNAKCLPNQESRLRGGQLHGPNIHRMKGGNARCLAYRLIVRFAHNGDHVAGVVISA
jgi:hypothetical protein